MFEEENEIPENQVETPAPTQTQPPALPRDDGGEWSHDRILGMFMDGKKATKEDLAAMSPEDRQTYDIYEKTWRETKNIIAEDEIKRQKIANEQLDYVIERTKDDEAKRGQYEKALRMRKYVNGDVSTEKGLNDFNVAAQIASELHDEERKGRGSLEKIGDSFVRGHEQLGTSVAQAIVGGFGDADLQTLKGLQLQQEMSDIHHPKAVNGLQDVHGVGDAFDFVMESVGENVERGLGVTLAAMATGGAAGLVGGAAAATAGAFAGGAAGSLAMNIGEAANDQIEEGAPFSRGYAVAQGVGYSAVEGALGIVPGLAKLAGVARGTSGKIAAKATVDALRETGRMSTARGAVKELMKMTLHEGAEEVAQSQLVGRARRLMQTGSALREDESVADALWEAADEFAGGAAAGLVMGGAGSAARHAGARRSVAINNNVVNRIRNDAAFNALSPEHQLLVGVRLRNDALLAVDGDVTGMDAKTRKTLEEQNAAIDESLRNDKGDGADAARAVLNAYTTLYAAEDFAATVDMLKETGAYRPQIDFERMRDSKRRVRIDENREGDEYTDPKTGIRVIESERDGKKEWTVVNGALYKTPMSADLNFGSLDEALAAANDLSAYNAHRAEKSATKRAVLKEVFANLAGGSGTRLLIADSALSIADPELRAAFLDGPVGNRAAYLADRDTVVVLLDQMHSLGEAYAALAHEDFHRRIAERIIGGKHGGTADAATRLEEGRQRLFGDGKIKGAKEYADRRNLRETVAAEELGTAPRLVSEHEAGEEIMADRAAVAELYKAAVDMNTSNLSRMGRAIVNRVRRQMADDMGFAYDAVTDADALAEIMAAVDGGFLRERGEEFDPSAVTVDDAWTAGEVAAERRYPTAEEKAEPPSSPDAQPEAEEEPKAAKPPKENLREKYPELWERAMRKHGGNVGKVVRQVREWAEDPNAELREALGKVERKEPVTADDLAVLKRNDPGGEKSVEEELKGIGYQWNPETRGFDWHDPNAADTGKTDESDANGEDERIDPAQAKHPNKDANNRPYTQGSRKIISFTDDVSNRAHSKLSQIDCNKKTSGEEFLSDIKNALGFTDDRDSQYSYVRLNGIAHCLRISNHHVVPSLLKMKKRNTSVVIRSKTHSNKDKFRPKNWAHVTEYEYVAEDLTPEKKREIVRGIQNWLRTGEFDGTNYDRLNVSPKPKAAPAAAQDAERAQTRENATASVPAKAEAKTPAETAKPISDAEKARREANAKKFREINRKRNAEKRKTEDTYFDDGHESSTSPLAYALNHGSLLLLPPTKKVPNGKRGFKTVFTGNDPAVEELNTFFDGMHGSERQLWMNRIFGNQRYRLSAARHGNDVRVENIMSFMRGGAELTNDELMAHPYFTDIGQLLNDFKSQYDAYDKWRANGAKTFDQMYEEMNTITYEDGESYYYDDLESESEAREAFYSALGFVERYSADSATIKEFSRESLSNAKPGDEIRFDHQDYTFDFESFDADTGILTVMDFDPNGDVADFTFVPVKYLVSENGITKLKENENGRKEESGADVDHAGDAQSERQSAAAGRQGESIALDGGTAADIKADAERIAAQEKKKAERKEIEERLAAPLKGGIGDLGQMNLGFADAPQDDLFAAAPIQPPSKTKSATSAKSAETKAVNPKDAAAAMRRLGNLAALTGRELAAKVREWESHNANPELVKAAKTLLDYKKQMAEKSADPASDETTGGKWRGDTRFSVAPQSAEERADYERRIADILKRAPRDVQGRLLAPNGKPTNLTERQYAQVRTPEFKRWFGDWETLARITAIKNIKAVDLSGLAEQLGKKDAENLFRSFGTVFNSDLGLSVVFPVETVGKILRRKGFDTSTIIPKLAELFAGSKVMIRDEKEELKEGHKAHPNIKAYHHLVNKFKSGTEEYYIRFILREEVAGRKRHAGETHLHSTFISDIAIYNESASTERTRVIDPDEQRNAPNVDNKIANFFASVKPAEVSKVVDENGEPLVVYRGTPERMGNVFEYGRNFYGGNKGFWFTSAKSAADSYSFDEVTGGTGEVKAVFLNIRDMMDLTPLKLNCSSREFCQYVKDNYGRDIGRGSSKVSRTNELYERHQDELYPGTHDGVKLCDVGHTYIAKSPPQIKSATDNTGAFDAANPDIRFSVAPNLRENIMAAVATMKDGNGRNPVRNRSIVPFSDTPEILRRVGIPSREIVTHAYTIRKMRDKHGLSIDDIAQIPHDYENPVMVIADDGKYYILSDHMVRTSGGELKPLMILLENRTEENNYIASAYSREKGKENAYINHARHGRILFCDPARLATAGLEDETMFQLQPLSEDSRVLTPAKLAEAENADIIPQSAASVNRDVRSRINMTSEDRRRTLLEETEDVARKDQIFWETAKDAYAKLASARFSVKTATADDLNYIFGAKASMAAHGWTWERKEVRPRVGGEAMNERCNALIRDPEYRQRVVAKALNNDALNAEESNSIRIMARDKLKELYDIREQMAKGGASAALTADEELLSNAVTSLMLAVRKTFSVAGGVLRTAQRGASLDAMRDLDVYLRSEVQAIKAKKGLPTALTEREEAMIKRQAEELRKANERIAELERKIEKARDTERDRLANAAAEEIRRRAKSAAAEVTKRFRVTNMEDAVSCLTGLDSIFGTTAKGKALFKAAGESARGLALTDEMRNLFALGVKACGMDVAEARKMILYRNGERAAALFDRFAAELKAGGETDAQVEKRAKSAKRPGGRGKSALDAMRREASEIAADGGANPSDARVAMGAYLRKFADNALKAKPDMSADELYKLMADEANAVDPRGGYDADTMKSVLIGSDGFDMVTRDKTLHRLLKLRRALALAEQGKVTEAAKAAGIRHAGEAEVLERYEKALRREMDRRTRSLEEMVMNPLPDTAEQARRIEELKRRVAELRDAIKEIRKGIRLAERREKMLERMKSLVEERQRELDALTAAFDPDAAAERKTEIEREVAELKETARAIARERNMRKRLMDQIAELNRRIEEQDFETPRAKPRPAPESYSEEVRRLMEIRERKREQFKREREKWEYRQLSGIQKVGADVKAILGEMKGIVASLDLSSVLRQGGQLTYAHPIKAVKNLRRTLSAMRSEKTAEQIMAEIKTRANARFYERAGLEFYDWGEDAVDADDRFLLNGYRILTGNKVVGGMVRASERAFATYLNLMMADTFDAMVAGSTYGSAERMTDSQLKAIGRFLNIAAQRGAIDPQTRTGRAMGFLNHILWSPRNLASRFQFIYETARLANPMMNPYGDKTLRGLFAKELVRYIGGVAAAIGFFSLVASLMRGDDEDEPVLEWDPRSSQFLRVRMGNTRLDFLSGLAQVLTFSARMTGKTKNARGQIRDTNFAETMGRFLRSKFAPSMSIAYDTYTGQTFERQNLMWDSLWKSDKDEKSAYRHIIENFVPLTFGDLAEQAKYSGVERTTITSVLTILGVGAQAYDPWNYAQTLGDYRYYKKQMEEMSDPGEREEMLRRHPMMRRSAQIEAAVKRVNALTNTARKMEAAGRDTSEISERVEREKKIALNIMMGVPNPTQVD